MRTAALLLLLLAGLASAASAGTPLTPQRIASLDLCTDELVVELADRRQILSLSPLARDPGVSTITAAASTLPNNRGSAELIVDEHPDLVLAERGAAATATNLLKRLGYRVELVEEAERLDQVAPLVRQVAALLGHPERGSAAVARMQEELDSLKHPSGAARTRALFYDSNGLSTGAATLQGDVLAAAGLDNAARSIGFSPGRPVSLETIVAHPPDLLITQSYRSGETSFAEAWPENPVLRLIPRHIQIPSSLLICGTPAVADAALLLARAR